jgi:hypothetical protein
MGPFRSIPERSLTVYSGHMGNFLLTDEQRKTVLLSPSAHNHTLSRSSGYVDLIAYAACKLNGAMSGQKTSTGVH